MEVVIRGTEKLQFLWHFCRMGSSGISAEWGLKKFLMFAQQIPGEQALERSLESGLQVPRGPLHQLGESGHLPGLDHEDPYPGRQSRNFLSPGQNVSNLNWVARISMGDTNYYPGYLWVKSAPELGPFEFTKCSQPARGDRISKIFLY